MANKKKKSNQPKKSQQKPNGQNVLGHDPFEDMDWGWSAQTPDKADSDPLIGTVQPPHKSDKPDVVVAFPTSDVTSQDTEEVVSDPIANQADPVETEYTFTPPKPAPEPAKPTPTSKLSSLIPQQTGRLVGSPLTIINDKSTLSEAPAQDNQAPPPAAPAQTDEPEPDFLDQLISNIDDEIEQIFDMDVITALSGQENATHHRGEVQYVIFTLAGIEYAVPAANVREVGELITLTPVPNVPPWLSGVTNLRGDILSVVDLRAFLGMAPLDYVESGLRVESSPGSEREMLVIRSQQDPTLIVTGLLVDEVNDIRYLTLDRINEPAAPIEDQIAPYLHGVYEEEGQLLVILDLERLLHSPEIQQFQPI